MRWLIRAVAALSLLAVICAVVLWAFLALPAFNDERRAIVAKALTAAVGRLVEVNGDTKLVVGATTRVTVSGVVLPSRFLAGETLAELSRLEFDLSLASLLGGRVDPGNLTVDGIRVEMLRTGDGATNWRPARPTAPTSGDPGVAAASSDNAGGAPPPGTAGEQGLVSFLASRGVSLSDIRVRYDDRQSGFLFDFDLGELVLKQLDDGATLSVSGSGSVNGKPFAISGTYPPGRPTETRASIGPVALAIDTQPLVGAYQAGFTGNLALDVPQLEEFLDLVGLEHAIDGTARLETDLADRNGVLSLSALEGSIQLATGQRITLRGGIEDLLLGLGADIAADLRLYPAGAPPRPARAIKDFRLSDVSLRLDGDLNALQVRNLLLRTNAFDSGLDRLGPVSVGAIRRTGKGLLEMTGIRVLAGPADRPILDATGNIRDLLRLQGFDLAGRFNAPASLFLPGLDDAAKAGLGRIESRFALDDAPGHLSITSIRAQAVEASVWALDADISFGDPVNLDGLSAEIALQVPDSKTFLTALDLAPADIGRLELQASATSHSGDWDARIGMTTDRSDLTLSAGSGTANDRPRIDATLVSERLAIADIRQGVQAVVDLIETVEKEARRKDLPLQPLVLPEGARDTASEDRPKLQPLVRPGKPAFDLGAFLKDNDVAARIELKRISGVEGVTSLASDLVAENGKARLGPIEFRYGGGSFALGAAMDLANNPDRVSVNGTTSGWDLAEIAEFAGLGIATAGTLSAGFDLTGNPSSVQEFLATMTGTATASVGRGWIGTSLLELAGLGIFPWLFSEELQNRRTELACGKVRIGISPEAITLTEAVVETGRVQLVARGVVNLEDRTLSLRVEPRRVGVPLSRSAWPFDVFGPLSDPRFKLDIGGSRSRRVDGADTMPADRIPCKPDIFQLQ